MSTIPPAQQFSLALAVVPPNVRDEVVPMHLSELDWASKANRLNSIAYYGAILSSSSRLQTPSLIPDQMVKSPAALGIVQIAVLPLLQPCCPETE